ncbi:hypothetical protein BEWA_024690 [Theileria equi strain WA]|uniref:Uncharacterized protein n=1 Tax=Theileria equi strain WA TaxID=1537102 RepID=L0AVP5_THEEQ|nr:hypothetical protein BEWA_024690 [Theileria equi strain WA]AFZ79620.1 hypothetical protein BEWA_024690 [Theileria equi strain WA]|eukprot:XP_004829286.1 hypothetical protein BEWA_024690 [Theileria equi strain WA]
MDVQSKTNMWIVVVRQMIETCRKGYLIKEKDVDQITNPEERGLIPREFERFKSIIILDSGLRDVIPPAILEIIREISDSFDTLGSSLSSYLLSELLFVVVGDDVAFIKDAMCITTKYLEISLTNQEFSPSNVERIITLMRLILAFITHIENKNNELLELGSEWRSAWEGIIMVLLIHVYTSSYTLNI